MAQAAGRASPVVVAVRVHALTATDQGWIEGVLPTYIYALAGQLALKHKLFQYRLVAS